MSCRRTLLIAGTLLALLIAVAGGVVTWQSWSSGSAITAQTGPTFGIIVGLEFALAGLGSGVLGVLKRAELIPAWVSLVVGVHFVPLALLLQYPLLYVVAVFVCGVALVAVPLARAGRSGERRHRAGHRDGAAGGGTDFPDHRCCVMVSGAARRRGHLVRQCGSAQGGTDAD